MNNGVLLFFFCFFLLLFLVLCVCVFCIFSFVSIGLELRVLQEITVVTDL